MDDTLNTILYLDSVNLCQNDEHIVLGGVFVASYLNIFYLKIQKKQGQAERLCQNACKHLISTSQNEFEV